MKKTALKKPVKTEKVLNPVFVFRTNSNNVLKVQSYPVPKLMLKKDIPAFIRQRNNIDAWKRGFCLGVVR